MSQSSCWPELHSTKHIHSSFLLPRFISKDVGCRLSFSIIIFTGSQSLCYMPDCVCLLSPDHYQHHWFPDRPQKGSGYRCIRINHEMDPLLCQAACRVGLNSERLFSLLPRELTLWIDPYEVSYRIGEDGSICVLYESEPPLTVPVPLFASFGPPECRNHFLMGGRTSPPKHYLMTVSS